MCGIFGFSSLTPNTRALIAPLAIEMSGRGRDSWGVTNGIEYYKDVGCITRTFDPTFLKWDANEGLIFHTRGASTGSRVIVDNAHPFRFTKEMNDPSIIDGTFSQSITGIHNGFVNNHVALKKHYPQRADYGVDSQHIFRHIIDGLSTDELDGSAVISWFDTQYTPDQVLSNNLYLARFKSDSLAVALLTTGELVFASTSGAIENATLLTHQTIEAFIATEQNVCYRVGKHPENHKNWLLIAGDMKWGGAPIRDTYVVPINYCGAGSTTPMMNNPSRARRSHIHPKWGKCGICDTTINSLAAVLCDKCFTQWLNGEVTPWMLPTNSRDDDWTSHYGLN